MATTKPAKVASKINHYQDVAFTLNSTLPNGLRRVIFGLEKDTQGSIVVWKIAFQLRERAKKTDAFGDAIVTLTVKVTKELHDKAEKASKALTPGTGCLRAWTSGRRRKGC